MVLSGVGALIGIIFGAICAAVLVAIGIATIRSGRTALTRVRATGQEVAWHKQVAILFGICNIVFAGILIMIMLLTLTVISTIKIIIFVILGILLVISVVLVVRCIAAALHMTTHPIATPPQDKDPS
jgi:hypothetical protein